MCLETKELKFIQEVVLKIQATLDSCEGAARHDNHMSAGARRNWSTKSGDMERKVAEYKCEIVKKTSAGVREGLRIGEKTVPDEAERSEEKP